MKTLSPIIVPVIALFYAQLAAVAQDSPALNVIPETARPPIPPPPETPHNGTAQLYNGAVIPQGWRVKALQLFKPNNGLDKSAIAAAQLQTSYDNAFEAMRGALQKAGIKLDALSFSSGHMLISAPTPNERGQTDRAIIALRQAALDSDSGGSGSGATQATDVRIFCDSRNRSLTLAQLKAILAGVDSTLADGKNRTGGQNL